MGLSLINPQGYSRKDALKIQGALAVRLMGGGFLLLFIAALVEGFWSPITSLPLWIKYTVAVCLWLGVYLYFFLAGRHHTPSNHTSGRIA